MAKLLIVENDFLISEALRKAVLAAGHVVVGSVGTSAEAYAAAQVTSPDLVLLDLGLEDGSEPQEVVRRLRATCDPAILICTGHDEEFAAAAARELGACGFMCKPVDYRLLPRLIERCLASRRSHPA